MAVWWRCRSSWLLIGKRWRPCCVLQFSFNISVQLNIYAVRFKWNCLSRLIRFKNVARFFSLFHCFRRKESYCRPGDGCRDVNVELLVLEKCKWWEILEIKISFSPFSPPPWSFLSQLLALLVCVIVCFMFRLNCWNQFRSRSIDAFGFLFRFLLLGALLCIRFQNATTALRMGDIPEADGNAACRQPVETRLESKAGARCGSIRESPPDKNSVKNIIITDSVYFCFSC